MSGNDNDLFDPSGNSALIGGDHLHIINEALEQINSSVTNDLSRPLRFRRHSSNQIINDSTTFLGPLMSNLIDYNSMNVPRRHPRVRIRQIPPVRRTRSTTTLRPGSTRFRLGPLESMLDRLGPTGGNDHTSFSSLLQGIGPLGNISRFREALRNSLGQRPTPFKKVLSEEGEKCIKDYRFEVGTQEEKCCPITQVDFTEGSVVARLPCKHIFDKQAILKWLREENARCPVCRYELPHKEMRITPRGAAGDTEPDPSGNEIAEETDHVESANILLDELQEQIMQMVTQQEEAEDERRLQAAILASLSADGATETPEVIDYSDDSVDTDDSIDTDDEMGTVD